MMSLVFVIMALAATAQSQKVTRITSVNDSYPAPSPDGLTILFQSDRSGDVEIWSMHSDGTNLVKLTSSPGFDGNPSWSPDGKTIAFTSTRDKNLEIYVMKSDGTGQTRLTQTPGNDGHPHWFPDGSRIIFNSARTSADEIFSMKPDGTDARQITTLKSVSTYASISPDGKRVVFRGSVEGPAYAWDMTFNQNTLNSEIFVMNIDGTELVNVSRSPAFDGWPYWSPDSKKVVFASNRSGKGYSGQLYLVNADGSELTQLTDLSGAVAQPSWSFDGKFIYGYQLWETSDEEYGHVIQVSVDSPGNPRHLVSVADSYPHPSPDGKSVVFDSNRTGDWEIYVCNADGKGLRQLTNNKGSDNGPKWSPDGSRILFVSERDGDAEIYIMNVDGSGQTRLTKQAGDDSHPHWYPDGSRIIFNSARNTPDLTKDWGLQYHDVYSMKIDGTDVQRLTDLKTVSTYPSMSPDGKTIMHRKVINAPAINWDMTANQRGRDSEVFIGSINISSHAAYDGWPAWSPDGKMIVFVSNRNGKASGGQLFLANADGTGLRQLTDLPGGIRSPSWVRDGKSILAYQCFEGADWDFGGIIKIELKP